MDFNYKEFYQKALVPMRDFDRNNFCRLYCNDCKNCIKANHWLIAIEGKTTEEDSRFQWNVSVYPAKENGVFWHLKSPYFQSDQPAGFDFAMESSKSIIAKLVNEELTAEVMMA